MTEPVRLLDGAGGAYGRELLASAVIDEPNDAALERMLARAAAGALVTTAAIGAGAAGVAGVTITAKSSLPAILVKWVGIGAVGGLATAGGAHYVAKAVTADAAESSPIATPRPAPTSVAQVSRSPEPTALSEDAPAAQQPAAPNATAAAKVAPTRGKGRASRDTAAAAPVPKGPNPLAIEVAALDSARRALSRGDASSASRALDDYAAARRTGVLDREAMILRIDVLVAQGARGQAASLAQRYVAQFPADPHVKRLESLIVAP